MSAAAASLTTFLTQDSGANALATASTTTSFGTTAPTKVGVVYQAPAATLIATTFKLWGTAGGTTVDINAAGPGAIIGSGPIALIRSDLVRGTLAVRNRRPGDRFRPVGLNGSRKLQDLFVDRKVARAERDGVPLVVDSNDRIVWVAGFGIDEAFRVTDASQGVLLLELKRVLGGSA